MNEEDLESISIFLILYKKMGLYNLNFFTEENYAAGILPVLPDQLKLYGIP